MDGKTSDAKAVKAVVTLQNYCRERCCHNDFDGEPDCIFWNQNTNCCNLMSVRSPMHYQAQGLTHSAGHA